MDVFIGGLPLASFLAAFGVTLAAGFVKGAIGFAMPLIMIAVLPSFMPAPVALAGLILPTLATNIHQSLRHGWAAAVASTRKFWRIILATVAGILVSAPFVVLLPQDILFLVLGVTVCLFAALQLSGWTPTIPAPWRNLAEFCFGFIGGLYGGVAGTWGPPSILFLLSIRVDKTEMVRVMSVIFAIGAVVLAVAHLRSGVLNAQTAQFSAAMLVPAGLGMLAGYKVHDRLDPGRFRFWTLVFLALMGLNLLRRGLLG